jgi:hypothetical protein
MVQINKIKGHSPQEGKNKWLSCFWQYSLFSSQVRLEERERGVLFCKRRSRTGFIGLEIKGVS